MPQFRSASLTEPTEQLTEETIAQSIVAVMKPGHFHAGSSLPLEWLGPVEEEVFWEIFQGRALDHTQTRRQHRFLSWNVWDRTAGYPSDEPLLSVKWDRPAGQLIVTRSILCHAWESFGDDQGAIQARETIRRVRELVGSIALNQFATTGALRDELIALLFRAVVGTSRLPLTSVEAPLPGFILGQFAYCFGDDAGNSPIRRPSELLDRALVPALAAVERSRLLEVILRNWRESDGPELGHRFLASWRAIGGTKAEFLELLRTAFNDASLSPYIGLVGATILFLRDAVLRGELSPADEIDFLTHLLRQIGRHLTAFDLVRFHHRGANYPDALLIEEVLQRLCPLIESTPELVLPESNDDLPVARAKRLRRRGLRQAWLLAGHYRGHKVPEIPTSPGENARVWTLPRLSDDQIANPATRTRPLFPGDWMRVLATPNVRAALRQSVADLDDPAEIRELGMALFLDRPFGVGKHPAEPDRTLLFSYEAFSRRIALERLREIGAKFDFADASVLANAVERCREADFVRGIQRFPARPAQRIGVVSLDDALLAADDFLFIRTTRSSMREFLDWYDTGPLAELLTPGKCLLLRSDSKPDEVQVYDADWNLRLSLRPDLSRGYVSRAGVEHPAEGLVADDIRLRPRLD